MRSRPLEFGPTLYERLRQLAEAAYPYEGCGILLGTSGAGGSVVTEVVEGHNLIRDRRHDRYELDPRDIIAAERRAGSRGEEVLGFYHTHPDHPARPSQFDTDHAWPGYHYVVISVEAGRLARASAWVLDERDGGRRFEERTLVAGGVGPAGYNPPGVVVENK